MGPEGQSLRLSRECGELRAPALLAIASFLVGARRGWTWSGQGSVLRALPRSLSQEERSVVSGCDGVSSCSFLSDNALFLTGFDGLLELWDLQHGCR